jgi:hypothetical protein
MPENQKSNSGSNIDSSSTSSSSGSDVSGIIAGVIFWIIFVAAIAYWFAPRHNRAEVFLEASFKQPIQISGVVLFKGGPISNGTVYVVFDDPRTNRYLGSAILPIGQNGAFTISEDSLAVSPTVPVASQAPLRVVATFSGQQPTDKKVVAGKAILYLNYPPPVGRWTIWTSAVIALILATGLITLFTGSLTQRKARVLFSITYIMTFMSLAVPIGAIVLVSKSQFAVEMMEQAPVGLIKGTAKGVQRPQWLINLGGAVSPAKDSPSEISTPSVPKEPAGRSAADANTTATPVQQAAPMPQENLRPDELRQTPGFAMVQGGLAVPFYVIILAILGAGINMTKKVPDIQKRHDLAALPQDTQSMIEAALRGPVAALVTSGPQVDTRKGVNIVAGIRKDLIDTYMGLISAPFLAIAVYYLLQIIATNIAEPVLVLVSFATGFISDSIVTAITLFASDLISRWQSKRNKNGAPTPPENE